MSRFLLAAVVIGFLFGAIVVSAQEGGGEPVPVDQALFEQGQQLFEANCAVCHQASGQGAPPTFPALAGNQNLQDLSLIVTNIHEGKGAMPPFPQFGAEQIAALASYIRNAWGNEFGGVDVDEVANQLSALEGEGAAADLRSVWDGVYSEEQAQRGSSVYTSTCSVCHGYIWSWEVPRNVTSPHLQLVSDPTLGPVLSGQTFLQRWDGQTVGALYSLTSSTMPLDNPGALSDQQYVDVIAFLFSSSSIPAGDEELPPDPAVLNEIVIEAQQGG